MEIAEKYLYFMVQRGLLNTITSYEVRFQMTSYIITEKGKELLNQIHPIYTLLNAM